MSSDRALALSAALCLLTSVLLGCNSGGGALYPGQRAPEIDLAALDGQPHSLAGFKGRALLVTFWASWCEACKDEMADLEKLHRDYKDRGLVVLAIGCQDSKERLQSFARDHKLSLPVVHDAAGIVQRRYGVSAFPESFVIDRSGALQMVLDPDTGKPVVRIVGPRDWSSPMIRRELDALLAKGAAR